MNQEKIGELIKKLRTDNNLTQAEFADKLGVTYQAVSKWENGKNIPDIALLKEISKIFNVNIDEIISGEVKDKTSKKNKLLIPLVVIITLAFLIITGLTIYIINDNKNHHNNETGIKKITASCDNFKVNGSLAYSADKSYIYISDIEFCGDEDVVYKEIECILYEKYGDISSKISSCDIGYNTTLKEHVKTVKLNAENYKTICTKTGEVEIYLEINAKTKDDKVISYKIPLAVDDTCSQK